VAKNDRRLLASKSGNEGEIDGDDGDDEDNDDDDDDDDDTSPERKEEIRRCVFHVANAD
jgi:hypothetical protein